jgi:hypothetical protein
MNSNKIFRWCRTKGKVTYETLDILWKGRSTHFIILVTKSF